MFINRIHYMYRINGIDIGFQLKVTTSFLRCVNFIINFIKKSFNIIFYILNQVLIHLRCIPYIIEQVDLLLRHSVPQAAFTPRFVLLPELVNENNVSIFSRTLHIEIISKCIFNYMYIFCRYNKLQLIAICKWKIKYEKIYYWGVINIIEFKKIF